MNKKYLVLSLISIVLLFSLSAVSAEVNDNSTLELSNDLEINDEKLSADNFEEPVSITNESDELKTSYYYNATEDCDYVDNSIITKNVNIYYGNNAKFNAKILNENGTPDKGMLVFASIDDKNPKHAFANDKGIVSFSFGKLSVGKHEIVTMIMEGDDNDELTNNYYWAYNKITVKSTIPTKTLTKSIKQKNKKFGIKFLDKKGKALKNKKVKIKVKSKTYTIKTNTKGIAKIKINNLKKGSHKILAINTVTKEKRKITVKITK